jgi:hypothetical protein
METQIQHDLVKEINEIRNQVSYSKRIGFLLGAGTSKSVGISDIGALTSNIDENLKLQKTEFDKLKFDDDHKPKNIEDILNQVRLIRQITEDKSSKNFEGITGEDSKKLDQEICNTIYDILCKEEVAADLNPIKILLTWLNWLSRDFTKEIFTTNYDLLIEKGFESLQIPYYDGFVGAHEPFFVPESLENDSRYDTPPNAWIRLWKIHGSLGWFWKKNNSTGSYRIVRLGIGAKALNPENEIVIYPSRDKYESSRKQPFIAYFDRLKAFLQEGEGLFIVSGYSFSDEHINAVIFNSLNQNNRLHIIGFFFSDSDIEKLYKNGNVFLNFTAMGPKKAIIKGFLGDWYKSKTDILVESFWDEDSGSIKLGDFRQLVRFFVLNSGRSEKIEAEIRSKDEK